MGAERDRPEEEVMRPLTRDEIEHRLRQIVAQMLPLHEMPDVPRWITAADLVRRVRPFLVYN